MAVLGVLAGILVAVILAMWDLIRRVARPHDAVLEVGNPDEPPHAVAEQKPTSHPQVLIYRVDAPLFFANANHVSDRILMLADARGPQLRSVMLDAEAIFYLDATAAAMLARITVELRRRGCGLVLARVREPVVQALHTSPYEQGITRELQIFPSVREAYAFIQRDSSKP